MMTSREMIQQLSLGSSSRAGKLVTVNNADEDTHVADLSAMQASLLQSCSVWPYDLHLRACPYPMKVPQSRLLDIEVLHRLLSAAITNIVERWWIDEDARFPERMPLEQHEEDVLRWMDSLAGHATSPYHTRQGSWRPDFLLEHVESREYYRICEINARFAFNGFLHTAFGQQAFIDMDKNMKLTAPATWPKNIFEGLLSLFDPSLPLHLLKGEEAGLDIHLFSSFVETATGSKPVFISPTDLRLVSDVNSPTGDSLYCVARQDENGAAILDRVYQVGLELHQRELHSMPPSILQAVALCCFNDLRTIFLIHDKRMLGIVLQELDSLVNVHKVLTPIQANILREGITATILPGSSELLALINSSEIDAKLKDGFLLKPIRSGKGAGIIFGSDLTPEAWLSQLSMLRSSEIKPDQTTYVVQRKIEQPRFDVALHEADGIQHNYLVGTYMSIHGQYLGLGLWRTSPERICAISRGGAWICSVIPKVSK